MLHFAYHILCQEQGCGTIIVVLKILEVLSISCRRFKVLSHAETLKLEKNGPYPEDGVQKHPNILFLYPSLWLYI